MNIRLDLERWSMCHVVIWDCNLLSEVSTSGGNKDQGAAVLPASTSHSRIYGKSIWVTQTCTVEHYGYNSFHMTFILSLFNHQTQVKSHSGGGFPLIQHGRRLLKQLIIITSPVCGWNKLPHLNLNFEMQMFLFRTLNFDLYRDTFSQYINSGVCGLLICFCKPFLFLLIRSIWYCLVTYVHPQPSLAL